MTPGLVPHLARFGRALRERGVGVSLSDEADGLTALTLVDLGDRDEVRRALRVALKIRQRDAAAFEEVFARLWRAGRAGEEAAQSSANPPLQAPRLPGAPRPPASSPRPRRPPESERAVEVTFPEGEEPGYSPEAVLRRKPFEEYSAADLLAMERLLARLALRLATRRSRRRVPARGRGEVDLRRSFRRALAHGGEFLSLARRARPVEEPRLVVLCDTSGSMDPHARFLLGFVLALRRVARSTEVFAFNTSLVRLTPFLRPGRIDLVLERLAAFVPDWSGGTRIGECLADFVAYDLNSMVNGRTVVLILSDGLDRGDVLPLAGAMRAIRGRARRVFWLNPLAGDARYEPTARAMAAALPYVDRLLPAHNLESLERLLPLLAA
ncbi:MAG TPA: VWA domain-containing protein [Thermoanaerobaculia bacterium]|nr:VWA domain-containing protein [Thermoanaerobaculia bacterium]